MAVLEKKNNKSSLYKKLCAELILNNQLKLIHARAKKLQHLIDKVIVLSKTNSLANRRLIIKLLHLTTKTKKKVLDKLFNVLSKKYEKQTSGFSRVLKLKLRKGDNSIISVIELV